MEWNGISEPVWGWDLLFLFSFSFPFLFPFLSSSLRSSRPMCALSLPALERGTSDFDYLMRAGFCCIDMCF